MISLAHSLRIPLLALCLVALSSAHAHAQAERSLERTLSLPADGRLELSTFSGEVTITSWDQDQVEVRVRIEGDTQEAVDKTVIEFEEGSRSVVVETNFDDLEEPSVLRDRDDLSPPDTYFSIRMPRTAALEIDVFSAAVNISDLDGDVDTEVFSGNVTVSGLRGTLTADVFSGDVTATGIRGLVDVSTFSGGIDLAFDAFTDDAEIETFSGNATARLPEDAGFELATDLGMSGNLDADFSLPNGTANGGGPRISFETFSGTLALRVQ